MEENSQDIVSKLKYEDEIKKLNYNFDGFSEQERIAYRWVHSNINDERNFLPRPKIKENYPIKHFTDWGISMFDAKENATKRLQELTKDKPAMYKKLGSCIAEGNVKRTHGICDIPATSGHFNLMEYKGVNITPEFRIITILYNE